MGAFVVVHCPDDLPNVVCAMGSSFRKVDSSRGGQEQADQDSDCRDDNDQLNECESSFAMLVGNVGVHVLPSRLTVCLERVDLLALVNQVAFVGEKRRKPAEPGSSLISPYSSDISNNGRARHHSEEEW